MTRLEKFALDQKLPLSTETVLKFIEFSDNQAKDKSESEQKGGALDSSK